MGESERIGVYMVVWKISVWLEHMSNHHIWEVVLCLVDRSHKVLIGEDFDKPPEGLQSLHVCSIDDLDLRACGHYDIKDNVFIRKAKGLTLDDSLDQGHAVLNGTVNQLVVIELDIREDSTKSHACHDNVYPASAGLPTLEDDIITRD
jgi:hypothetical protein